MGLCYNVYGRIEKEREVLRFTNIFGNLAREQILMSNVKAICSRVRNTFRENVSSLSTIWDHTHLYRSRSSETVFLGKR